MVGYGSNTFSILAALAYHIIVARIDDEQMANYVMRGVGMEPGNEFEHVQLMFDYNVVAENYS